MAELNETAINPDWQAALDQSILRLPQELARKNHKTAQRIIEKEKEYVSAKINDLLAAFKKEGAGRDPQQVQTTFRDMIARLQHLKDRLVQLQAEEEKLQRQSRARIDHLAELYTMKSLADIKFDEWSRERLDRLLVDHLLRNGYTQSAEELMQEKGIQNLVDVQVFSQSKEIEANLRNRRTQEALAWCAENKQALRKMESDLEYQIRLQQYIEMIRDDDEQVPRAREILTHARKFLSANPEDSVYQQAAGLLACEPEVQVQPFEGLFSDHRWAQLAHKFVLTHNQLLGIPSRSMLQTSLSAGLSALKTVACHSKEEQLGTSAMSSTSRVCPVCSTEVNELARHVPYALHTRSKLAHDSVALPNGRVYSMARLAEFNEKFGTPGGYIRDPSDHEAIFDSRDLKPVYSS